MKALARALVNAAAFLELSEGVFDPDAALQALEEIGLHLGHCTAEEKKALTDVLSEMRAAELESGPRPEVLEFLDTFPESFGLDDAGAAEAPEDSRRINLL